MHRLKFLLLHKSSDDVLGHCAAHRSWVDCQPGSSVDALKDALCFSVRFSAKAADASVPELEAGLESG